MANQNLWAMLTRVANKYYFGKDASMADAPPIALNDEYVKVVNAAGTGTINVFKANTSNQIVRGIVPVPGADVYVGIAPAEITTAGAATYTIAQLLTGYVRRDCTGASRSDVTPTAALVVAAFAAIFGAASVGMVIEFTIKNTSDAAETITVTGGTGGTVVGTATIAQNNSKRFRLELTNVTATTEAYRLDSLGTVVH